VKKYLIIDDENDLYRHIFKDLFYTSSYDIKEIKKINIDSKMFEIIYKIHFSNRINKYVILPFKNLWNNYYTLAKYKFESTTDYYLIFLNGSIRYHYSYEFLKEIKEKNPNIHFILLMYDNWDSIVFKDKFRKILRLFNYVFSFDVNDCKKYGFIHLYSTFSRPDNMKYSNALSSDLFFIGWGQGRLGLLKGVAKKLGSISQYKSDIRIRGVKLKEQESIKGVTYNTSMTYDNELLHVYNTNCVLEIVKEYQSGITLRTCEAIAFNKKLMTNNTFLRDMPFYDPRFMRIIESPEDIDTDFLRSDIDVDYKKTDFFSPLNIIKKLEELEQNK
jgi:hypothetical protein